MMRRSTTDAPVDAHEPLAAATPVRPRTYSTDVRSGATCRIGPPSVGSWHEPEVRLWGHTEGAAAAGDAGFWQQRSREHRYGVQFCQQSVRAGRHPAGVARLGSEDWRDHLACWRLEAGNTERLWPSIPSTWSRSELPAPKRSHLRSGWVTVIQTGGGAQANRVGCLDAGRRVGYRIQKATTAYCSPAAAITSRWNSSW